MPRNIEFDHNTVMLSAMREFRQHGYAGTSIKSLENVTGLSSGSLYNSFGGKDAIFVCALNHYNNVVVRQRVKEHLESKQPQEGIRSLFLSLLDYPDDQPYGCLLTNSAVEFGAENSTAKPGIEEGFEILEKGFQSALDRLLYEQNVEAGSQAAQRYTHSATKLLAFYQGILVLVRFGRPKEKIRTLINDEINQLTGTTT